MTIRTSDEIKNAPAIAFYADRSANEPTLPQVTFAATRAALCVESAHEGKVSRIEKVLTGQSSTIRKIEYFRAGIFSVIVYELAKISTYFKALSCFTTDETKKFIKEISTLDNLTGQIRNTANKIARVLNNNTSDNLLIVHDLLDQAEQLNKLEKFDAFGSKTQYEQAITEALCHLVKNNTAGFFRTNYKVENIEAFKTYLLSLIQKTEAVSTEAQSPTTQDEVVNEIPAEVTQVTQEPALAATIATRQAEAEGITPARRDSIDEIISRNLPEDEELQALGDHLVARLQTIAQSYGFTFQSPPPAAAQPVIQPAPSQQAPVVPNEIAPSAAITPLVFQEQYSEKNLTQLIKQLVPKLSIEDKLFLTAFIRKKESFSPQYIADIAKTNPNLAQQLRNLETIIKVLTQKENVSEQLLQVIKSQGTSNSTENLVWHLKYLLPTFHNATSTKEKRQLELDAAKAIYNRLKELNA